MMAHCMKFRKFQSTLPRRERQRSDRGRQPGMYFNPRSREGSDYHFYWFSIIQHMISIHAPAKGATSKASVFMKTSAFQSTLPRRERPLSLPVHTFHKQFQSTLPRRERRCFYSVTPVIYNFNPRSREGSDKEYCQYAH